MNAEEMRKWALAAIPGGLGMAVGVTAAVLDELEYNGVTDETIPDAIAISATAIGSILFMVALTSIRRLRPGPGAVGYWIAMAGLVLSLAPVWPLVFLGPVLLGLGVTIYSGATVTERSLRSFGSWLHLFSIPTGVVSGLAFSALGLDGGIGMIVFMALVITGFMTLGFDAAAPSRAQGTPEVAA